MSQSPSKLNCDGSPLFLDASVIINLVASNQGDADTEGTCPVLLLSRKRRVTEFKRDPRDGSDAKAVINSLVSDGRLKVHIPSPIYSMDFP